MSWLDDPDDVVAHHEAGHAVASYVLRQFLGTVTIDPPDDQHVGGTEVWVLPPPLVDEEGKIVEKDAPHTSDELSCFEDATMIAMAGPVAETIYWPTREYDEVLSKNCDDQGKVLTITRKIWRERAREVELQLESRIRQLLKQEWPGLERLATLLEEKRTLDGSRAISAIKST